MCPPVILVAGSRTHLASKLASYVNVLYGALEKVLEQRDDLRGDLDSLILRTTPPSCSDCTMAEAPKLFEPCKSCRNGSRWRHR